MILLEDDVAAVETASRKVVQHPRDAGVWIFGGGLQSQRANRLATGGTVTDGPCPETRPAPGGFAIVDVPSREEALEWAAKLAACRCMQEVRETMRDPES